MQIRKYSERWLKRNTVFFPRAYLFLYVHENIKVVKNAFLWIWHSLANQVDWSSFRFLEMFTRVDLIHGSRKKNMTCKLPNIRYTITTSILGIDQWVAAFDATCNYMYSDADALWIFDRWIYAAVHVYVCTYIIMFLYTVTICPACNIYRFVIFVET